MSSFPALSIQMRMGISFSAFLQKNPTTRKHHNEKKKQRKVLPKQPQQSFKNAVFSLLLLSGPTSEATSSLTMHTVSFDWFLFGLEWILNLEFCLQKLLIFYQKLVWNIRSRLNFSTFWVFEPIFRYVWSKLKLFAQKMKILIKHM